MKIIIKILFVFLLFFFFACPADSLCAADVNFKPQVTIGDFQAGENKEVSGSTIGEYIVEIYKYAVGAVGILAVIVMMLGGVRWLTAGGSAERIGDAKAWVGASLTGMVLVFGSYLVLKTINPELISFKNLDIADIKDEKMGCCEWPVSEKIIPMIVEHYHCIEFEGTFYGDDYYVDEANYKCSKYSQNNEECDENQEYKKCKPGLKCINLASFVTSKDDFRCTDGKNGSPCHERKDCTCDKAQCFDKKCKCY